MIGTSTKALENLEDLMVKREIAKGGELLAGKHGTKHELGGGFPL